MNSSWLLVFKEDIVSQPAQVQKALFEQFVLLVLDVPGLARLEETAARQVVRDVYIQTIHSRFAEMNGDEIARQLKFRTSVFIQLHKQKAEFSYEDERHCQAATLLQGWSDISAYLNKKKKQRRSLRQWVVVWGLVVILLMGGFLFGTAAPVQEVYSSPGSEQAQMQLPPLEGPLLEQAGQLRSISVSEREAKAYADFTLIAPAYLPPGYQFSDGEVWLKQGASKAEHAVLTYTNEQKHLLRLIFYKLQKNGAISSGMFSPSTTKEVFLRGSKGLVSTAQNGGFQLNWIEHDDTYISISGRELEEEQVIQMAESLK